MKKSGHNKIRQTVRESYAKVAKTGISDFGKRYGTTSCCSPSNPAEIKKGGSQSCCGKGVSLEQMSEAMGYSKEDIVNVPQGSNMGLGCGNPVALSSLKPGETVVDLGSGGGFDCFLAAKQVSESGEVIGVDMTPEMVTKARKNTEKAGVRNVDFRLGEIEHLPVADNYADIIMSNCVINLSPDKLRVYKDAFRVLKPGGRLAISDIVALKPLPDSVKKDLALVSACIGGAATIEDTKNMLKQAGFQKISITPKEVPKEIIDELLPDSDITNYVISAYIQAQKPGGNSTSE